MIKVITFDLDGVYFPNGKQVFISSLEKLGVNNDETKRVFAKSPEMNEQYKLDKLTDEQFWTWAINEWKLSINWKDIIKLMIDSYTVDSRVEGVVKRAREKGYKTAICTSNFRARINGLQEKFNFLDNFDIKVISYEIGYNKPDKNIFMKLVEHSKVLPEEIVYADDNTEAVDSAKEVGITTFLYQDFDTYLNQLKSVGVEI